MRGQSRPDAGAQSSRFLPPEGSLLCAWCGHPRPGRGNPDVSAPAPGRRGSPPAPQLRYFLLWPSSSRENTTSRMTSRLESAITRRNHHCS